jgi:hypothetical protein
MRLVRLVPVCLALSSWLVCVQASAEGARTYLGFAGGLAAAGPALAEQFQPGVTLEGFVGYQRSDSMVIRLGIHWIGFGVAAGGKVVGPAGAGGGRPIDGSIDDTQGVSVMDVRATVLLPARGSGVVRPYAGSGLGLARVSLEDDEAEWACVLSPTIGVRIHGSRSVFAVEAGVETVFPGKARFGALTVRVIFPF